MLLKIYTRQNTVKIIADIEEPEIHSGYSATTWADIYSNSSLKPHRAASLNHIIEVENYDWEPSHHQSPASEEISPDCKPPIEHRVSYVDFKRNGDHRRVAVLGKAYLCNDQGKTIERIE